MRMAAIAFMAFLFSACWSPIYNERLSASAVLSLKLDSLALEQKEIGPVSWSLGNSDSSLEYLPSKFNDLGAGLLVERGKGNISFRYFGQRDANSAPEPYNSQNWGEGFAERAVFVSASVSVQYAARPLLIGLNNNSAVKSQDIRNYYRDPTDPSCNLVDWGVLVAPSGLPSPSYLVAAGSVLDTNGFTDDIELLYWDAGNGYNRLGFMYDTPPASYPDGNSPIPVTGIGITVNRGSKFFRLVNDFYLCAYTGPVNGESIRCFRWVDSGVTTAVTLSALPVELTSITMPIVGILHNGLILAQDDLFLYTFSKEGTQLSRVLAGNLRFMQEFSVSGYPCAIFSQVISMKSSYQSKIAAKIWAVRSDAVLSIGN